MTRRGETNHLAKESQNKDTQKFSLDSINRIQSNIDSKWGLYE